jgi:hypothetical protein
MKILNILLILLGIFFSSSCKKVYTCSCTTTLLYTSGGAVNYLDNSEKYSEKMNKRTAESACENKEKSLNSSYSNALSNNGSTASPVATAVTQCVL